MTAAGNSDNAGLVHTEDVLPRGYTGWRRVHLIASWLVTAIGVAHCTVAALTYDAWTPRAVWFTGAGLGVILIGTLNLAHIGLGPCRMPTARFVRIANWLYAVFGVTAVAAVPEPPGIVLAAALAVQAVAARNTMPGPVNE